MPSQHFKSVLEIASAFASIDERQNVAHRTRNVQLTSTSFEEQLAQGLYVNTQQLTANRVGWSYRSSPVMLYSETGKREIHISNQCPSTENLDDWVWACNTRNNHNANYTWCPSCLQILHQMGVAVEDQPELFKSTVKHFYYEYFLAINKPAVWAPGFPVTPLNTNHSHDSENSLNHEGVSQCGHCTWKLPSDSPFILSHLGEESPKQSQHHCLFCANAASNNTIIVPEKLRWQGLQKRFHYFDGHCTNWAQLRFHLDISWHPLLLSLQSTNITLPSPYQVISEGRYDPVVAPIAWVDQKKAVLPDYYTNTPKIKKDWEVLTYSSLLASLAGA